MSHLVLQEEEITPRSALPYRSIHEKGSTDYVPVVPRASRQSHARHETKQSTKALPQSGRPRGAGYHKLFFVGIGMLLALALVVLGHLALNWISVTEDDLHYGRPRTYQIDAFVGHETTGIPSHFIALNLQGRIEVIEFPGGVMSKGRFIPRRSVRKVYSALIKGEAAAHRFASSLLAQSSWNRLAVTSVSRP